MQLLFEKIATWVEIKEGALGQPVESKNTNTHPNTLRHTQRFQNWHMPPTEMVDYQIVRPQCISHQNKPFLVLHLQKVN